MTGTWANTLSQNVYRMIMMIMTMDNDDYDQFLPVTKPHTYAIAIIKIIIYINLSVFPQAHHGQGLESCRLATMQVAHVNIARICSVAHEHGTAHRQLLTRQKHTRQNMHSTAYDRYHNNNNNNLYI